MGVFCADLGPGPDRTGDLVAAAAKKPRLTRTDWLDIGIAALADPAAPALTVETVCARAGKTPGGFYFHFDGIEDYLAALAQRWRHKFTDALIEQTGGALPPAERLDRLNYLAVHLDQGVEQRMRRLAARQPQVARIVRDVDRRRTEYLAELYAASDRFTPASARALARAEYAAFVGLQQTEADAGADELLELYQEFLTLTGRKPDETKQSVRK